MAQTMRCMAIVQNTDAHVQNVSQRNHKFLSKTFCFPFHCQQFEIAQSIEAGRPRVCRSLANRRSHSFLRNLEFFHDYIL